MIVTERYNISMSAEWDAAVAASRNGTFLHMRGYMDYHSDRFTDFSLALKKDISPPSCPPSAKAPSSALTAVLLTGAG